MHRPAHALRRGAPAALVGVLVCVLVMVALTALLPPTHAAFSATTATPANTLSADQLAPPSGLSAVQTCSTPPLIAFRAADTPLGEALLSSPADTRWWLAGTIKRDEWNGGNAAEMHLEDAARA